MSEHTIKTGNAPTSGLDKRDADRVSVRVMFNKVEKGQKPDTNTLELNEISSERGLLSKKTDEDASGFLEDIYRNHWHEICHYLRAKYGDGPPDPEDIAQAAFTKFASYKTPEHIKNPRAFLYSMARNIFIDHHRRKATWDKFVAEEKITAETTISADFDPERVLMGKEEFAMLEIALCGLDKRQRDFLLMHRLQGMSYTEIARRSGMSRNGVKGVIKQAFAACQEKMDLKQQMKQPAQTTEEKS